MPHVTCGHCQDTGIVGIFRKQKCPTCKGDPQSLTPKPAPAIVKQARPAPPSPPPCHGAPMATVFSDP